MPDDPAELINRLVAGMSLPEQRDLMATLLDQRSAAWLNDLRAPPTPTLLRKPRKVRGFQVRLDLRFTK